MNPFKVGDRVRCVRASRCLVDGDLYIVAAVKRELGTPFVRLAGADGEFYYCDRFVLAKPMFKGNVK